MAEQFYKGRTNNHLTWVMVDATDFATPESALSAATKIKIYGKLRSGTGVNFVSSGTGSLTNDIQHVGASALGIYTIALAKADLSDASAAWYDQYIISLSATGAAYQTIVADGGIDFSGLSSIGSDIYSLLSDVGSDVIVMSGIVSDAYSAILLAQSMASDAASAAQQTNSRVLLVQSRLSDLDSRLVSDISDILSMVTGLSATLSDVDSALTSQFNATSDAISNAYSAAVVAQALSASDMSDLRSAIAAVTATVSASDISDIASAVRATLVSDLSDILSAATQTNSRVILVQSRLSDLDSRLSSEISDVYSLLSDTFSTMNSQFAATSDIVSNVYSALTTARAEPGQGTPAATLAALDKLDYLYKAWRNRTTQTATEYALYGDDGVTKDQKATVSDDATTFDRGEVTTGL